MSCVSKPVTRLVFRHASSSSTATARHRRLREVYAPFQNLVKGSSAYDDLARSGRVWENYFKPWDVDLLGYTAQNKENTVLLKQIDDARIAISTPMSKIAKSLVAEFAHQSVALENNALSVKDSIVITEKLDQYFALNRIKIGSMPVENILTVPIPETQLPSQGTGDFLELANHVIASLWIAERASPQTRTSSLNEVEVRCLSSLTNRGTPSEALYTRGWGDRISLGDYRATPISVKSDPLCIFPYHIEVPAVMKRFFQWRDQMHTGQKLHPLVLACHLFIYFEHIHPFPDGNGRVGRMLMQDYMARQGYPPLVIPDLARNDYLSIVKAAQAGQPEEWVKRVLLAQMDRLLALRHCEISGRSAEGTFKREDHV